MDFEEIDRVVADDLGPGDIVQNDEKEFLQIRDSGEDEGDIITYGAYNLSTGDEDSFIADPADFVLLFRSY
jgi:hypothetical protein